MTATAEQTSRFNELKQKGWKNLNGLERQEFQTLSAVFKDNPPVLENYSPDPVKQNKDEDVVLKRSELSKILDRLNHLERGVNKEGGSVVGSHNAEWEEIDTKPRTRTATVRILDGKYLVDWHFERRQFNEKIREMEDIYKITLFAPDKKTTETVEFVWRGLPKLQREEVTILETKVKALRKVVGKTRTAIVDYDNYRTRSGDQVDMEVRALKRTMVIQFKDGNTYELDESRLNA